MKGMNSVVKVLVVEPAKAPRESEIEGSVKPMQELVGGYIEVLHPFRGSVVLVCNENGKLDGLPLNRVIQGYSEIVGTFFIFGIDGEEFTSLSPKMIKKFSAMFAI
jgi:hypothetical protein